MRALRLALVLVVSGLWAAGAEAQSCPKGLVDAYKKECDKISQEAAKVCGKDPGAGTSYSPSGQLDASNKAQASGNEANQIANDYHLACEAGLNDGGARPEPTGQSKCSKSCEQSFNQMSSIPACRSFANMAKEKYHECGKLEGKSEMAASQAGANQQGAQEAGQQGEQAKAGGEGKGGGMPQMPQMPPKQGGEEQAKNEECPEGMVCKPEGEEDEEEEIAEVADVCTTAAAPFTRKCVCGAGNENTPDCDSKMGTSTPQIPNVVVEAVPAPRDPASDVLTADPPTTFGGDTLPAALRASGVTGP